MSKEVPGVMGMELYRTVNLFGLKVLAEIFLCHLQDLSLFSRTFQKLDSEGWGDTSILPTVPTRKTMVI